MPRKFTKYSFYASLIGTLVAGSFFYNSIQEYKDFKIKHYERLNNQNAIVAHKIHRNSNYLITHLDELISGRWNYLPNIEEGYAKLKTEELSLPPIRKNFEEFRTNLYFSEVRAEEYEKELVGESIHEKERLFNKMLPSFLVTFSGVCISLTTGLFCIFEKIDEYSEKRKDEIQK